MILRREVEPARLPAWFVVLVLIALPVVYALTVGGPIG